jgi:hypothetical protein
MHKLQFFNYFVRGGNDIRMDKNGVDILYIFLLPTRNELNTPLVYKL